MQAHRFSCIYELHEIRNHSLFCPQSLFNVCGVDNGICSALSIKIVEIILFLKWDIFEMFWEYCAFSMAFFLSRAARDHCRLRTQLLHRGHQTQQSSGRADVCVALYLRGCFKTQNISSMEEGHRGQALHSEALRDTHTCLWEQIYLSESKDCNSSESFS